MATLEEQVAERIRHKEFVSTVAESLEFRLGLPRGRGLVGVIGEGHERTNREALETWIVRHWDCTDGNAREATETLASELFSLLEDLRH